MNREIKFRAWDKINKWMDNDVFVNSDGVLYEEAHHKYDTPNKEIELCKENSFIIMLFTGLHDKNGVPIYEGDIIEIEDRILLVKYDEKKATFISKFLKYKGDINPNFEGIENRDWAYYDVIGNIYENENLLKQKGGK